MRASALEFRLRMAINAAFIILGFWAPWIEYLHIGRRIALVEWLALQISRLGLGSFGTATGGLIAIAAIFAAAGAAFRVWGTAYLGPSTVNSLHMIAGKVMADGPYRYLRNPLYVGLWCMVAGMAFLMPASGALVAMALITLFMVRLTLGEEAFLAPQLGEPYQAYLRAVPRFIPRLRGVPAATGAEAHWFRAALAGRTILVFFGASLIVRAFMPRAEVSSEPAK
jgi:protein-S-isoprenylcysteine O-methyltransferase Ste14